MVTDVGLLSGSAVFLHWGVVQISLANFIVVLLMVLLFVLAVTVPFPDRSARSGDGEDGL